MTDAAETLAALEIEFGGEIDLSNASALGDDLCDAMHRAGRNPAIIVDLSAVTFIDSSAIAMMIRVHTYAERSRRTVTWRNLQAMPRRTLEITGVDKVLNLD
jgi:anti-anti-sigma factor